jgi:hypothetical protein
MALTRKIHSLSQCNADVKSTASQHPPPPPNKSKPVFRIRIYLIRIRIRIQHFRLNTNPDPGFFYSWKKITIFLSLGLHKGRLSYRGRLQLSKENIQHFKTRNFLVFSYICGSFLPSLIRIRIRFPNTDPNLLTWLNPDPVRIRNTNSSGRFSCIMCSIPTSVM